MVVHVDEARVTETARGPVEYALTGGSGPVVLGSHGGLGGIDQCRLVLGWLEPVRYRLLAVSRPGYLGTPLSSGRDPREQADLFAALLDALGIDRVAVVTLSSGGPAGYLLAARHPDRVTALVAIDSVTGDHQAPETAGPVAQAVFTSRAGQALTRALARHRPAWLLRQLLASESRLGRQQVRRHTAAVLGSPPALEFLRAFVATLSPYRPRMPGTDNDTAHLRRLEPLPLHDIRCPVLVVHGTHDGDVPLDHGERAAARIAGAEHHWIDEGSHLGFWLSPGAPTAQARAREFLDRHHFTQEPRSQYRGS
jgi:pimeloyl-ACP methyl ester carboxylesterase